MLIRTLIDDSLSIHRWKRDRVFVTGGMKECYILGISEFPILVKCALIRVVLGGHIKGHSSVTMTMLPQSNRSQWDAQVEARFVASWSLKRKSAQMRRGGQWAALTRPSMAIFIGKKSATI